MIHGVVVVFSDFLFGSSVVHTLCIRVGTVSIARILCSLCSGLIEAPERDTPPQRGTLAAAGALSPLSPLRLPLKSRVPTLHSSRRSVSNEAAAVARPPMERPSIWAPDESSDTSWPHGWPAVVGIRGGARPSAAPVLTSEILALVRLESAISGVETPSPVPPIVTRRCPSPA